MTVVNFFLLKLEIFYEIVKVEPYHLHHIKRRITLRVGEGEGVDLSVWPPETAVIRKGECLTQYPVLVIDQ